MIGSSLLGGALDLGISYSFQISNNSFSWTMRSLISLLGFLVGGGFGPQADDAIASLAFADGLTVRLERDVCSLEADVCFVFSSLWTLWPLRDDTALSILLLKTAAALYSRDDTALALLFLDLGFFAFSA